MKIIHIASFAGNLGDIINHLSFYSSMCIDAKNVKKIEIRKFYRNQGKNRRLFDKEFADEINQYDLLVLGGGGFFDVYFNESETGTTFDMSEQFINSIAIPVVVNAMGFHVDRSKKKAIGKFNQFIDLISSKDNWFVSIRNDGSSKRMSEIYGTNILAKLHIVPDNGFLFKAKEYSNIGKKIIGMSITNEMIDSGFTKGTSINKFNEEIAKIIIQLLNKDYICCFFIHTPQDIETLDKIMKICGRELFRNKIIIAPYIPFLSRFTTEFTKYYSCCDLVVGMRFHANVLAMALHIPVIGLAMHEQISGLYEEIALKGHYINVGDKEWATKLMIKIFSLIKENTIYLEEQNLVENRIATQHNKYVQEIKDFLETVKNE